MFTYPILGGLAPFEISGPARFSGSGANYYRSGVGNMGLTTSDTAVTQVLTFKAVTRPASGQALWDSTKISGWEGRFISNITPIVLRGFAPRTPFHTPQIYPDSSTQDLSAVPFWTSGGNNGWMTICMSWDMASGACSYRLNGNADSFTENNPGGETIQDLSSDESFIGSGRNHNAGDSANIDVALFWMDDSYIDFTQQANYDKFFDSNNKPIYLGANGELPTGGQPLHYAPDGHLTTNLGSQSNWVEVGTVGTASTSPTD